MTDNTADERPLPLGDLAEADSPEIVRAALGRFRRRLLIRGLILALAIGAAFVLYPRYFEKPKELQQEILEARGVFLLTEEVKGGFIDAQVVRAARLSQDVLGNRGQHYGITLHFSAHFLEPNEQAIPLLQADARSGVLDVVSGNGAYSGTQIWISLAAGTGTVDIPFAGVVRTSEGTRLAHPTLGTIHLDMQALHIPDWIWRRR